MVLFAIARCKTAWHSHSYILFTIYYTLICNPLIHTTPDINVKRYTYSFPDDANILHAYIQKGIVKIILTKNKNPLSKIIKLNIYEIALTKNGMKTHKTISKRFNDIKKLHKLLREMQIKSIIFNYDLYGDYNNAKPDKTPVINYSKLEKKITFNNTDYTIIQQRVGSIKKLQEIRTKITIIAKNIDDSNNKIVFDKQYPLLIPFSFSEINKTLYIHLCSVKLGLLKSTIEYIFNKGLAMNCSSINLRTGKEETLITTYFDPNEFGNIMRGFPLIYVLPIGRKKIDKIIAVLHKKKIVLFFCKSGSYECEIEKKMSISIEFPKMVLTSINVLTPNPQIMLIYQNKLEVISIQLPDNF